MYLQYYLERAGQPDWGLAVDAISTVNGEKGWFIQYFCTKG